MATVLPFRGARFDVSNKRLFSLLCPPFDEVSAAERAELLDMDEENIVSVELPEGEDRYKLAKQNLDHLFEVELMHKDKDEGFYIYQIEYFLANSTRTIEYIIGRCRLEAYADGVVLPHETALPREKEDRAQLLESCRANVSAVSAIFSDPALESQQIANEVIANSAPLHVAQLIDTTHRLFAVTDSATIWRIQDLFKDKQLVIADGHSRYESALAYKSKLVAAGKAVREDDAENHIMMALCAAEHPGLCIYPSHRVVAPIDGFNAAELIDLLKEDFVVEPVTAADSARMLVSQYLEGKNAFLLYDKQWYTLLTLKDQSAMKFALPTRGAALRALDATVLQSLVFEKIFNITKGDLAAGRDISYTPYTWRAEQLVDSGDACCAFLLNPVRAEQVLAVAQEDERMPYKSSYFFPKLLTGLVINKL